MTFRDTSADVTLDNANEGIMSNEFEKWFAGEHGVPQDCRVFARAAYQFRQSEIDALNVALLAEQTKCAGFAPVVSRLLEENTALKAENERLLPYVDAFRREEGRADKLDRKVDELNAENERLREALQASLQWIDSVPSDTLLPTMPGFDRDYVDGLLAKDFSTQQPVGCSDGSGTIIGYEKPVKAEPD